MELNPDGENITVDLARCRPIRELLQYPLPGTLILPRDQHWTVGIVGAALNAAYCNICDCSMTILRPDNKQLDIPIDDQIAGTPSDLLQTLLNPYLSTRAVLEFCGTRRKPFSFKMQSKGHKVQITKEIEGNFSLHLNEALAGKTGLGLEEIVFPASNIYTCMDPPNLQYNCSLIVINSNLVKPQLFHDVYQPILSWYAIDLGFRASTTGGEQPYFESVRKHKYHDDVVQYKSVELERMNAIDFWCTHENGSFVKWYRQNMHGTLLIELSFKTIKFFG